jgi:hypothetical protein
MSLGAQDIGEELLEGRMRIDESLARVEEDRPNGHESG